MRRHTQRKVTATVNLELEQLERVDALAQRVGLNRSIIIRDALDRELARYEKDPKAETPAREGQGRTTAAAVSRRP